MWTRLKSRFPARPEQQAEAAKLGQTLDFDIELFPTAAVAHCLRWATNPDGERITFDRPGWSSEGDATCDLEALDLAHAVWDTFPLGDTSRLWAAVLEVNARTPLSGAVQSFATGPAKTRSGGR